MAQYDALLKEFEAVEAKYNELLGRLVEAKIPGIVLPKAAGCNVGEVCHGGQFKLIRDPGRPVEKG
jgi:hypothetical protein